MKQRPNHVDNPPGAEESMMDNHEFSFALNRTRAFGAALLVAIFIVYGPIFVSDYLMNDELNFVGTPARGLFSSVWSSFLSLGRGLFGLFRPLVFGFAGYDPMRIQLVRFGSVAAFSVIAVLVFQFVVQRTRQDLLAFIVVLLLFTSLSVQGIVGYAFLLSTSTLPSVCFSMAALFLHFSVSTRLPSPVRHFAVFMILMCAMQSAQSQAFCSMAPAAFVMLKDWTGQRKRMLSYLALALFALLTSTIIYKVGLDHLHASGRQGYGAGEAMMEAFARTPRDVVVAAINPFSYWSAFQLWSYPFPWNNVAPLGHHRQAIGCLFLGTWLILVGAAFVLEWRRSPQGSKNTVAFKWLTALGCLAFGALVLIADSQGAMADHRPHIFFTLTGEALFVGAYALEMLASRFTLLSTKGAHWAVGAVAVYSCFGAQAGVLRGIITPRVDQLNFVRTELASARSIGTVAVILPSSSGPCAAEPCNQWMGGALPGLFHLTRSRGYRYALATIGVSPELPHIAFYKVGDLKDPILVRNGVDVRNVEELPEDAVRVDWNKFLERHLRLAAH
jgi:hypothetical protein